LVLYGLCLITIGRTEHEEINKRLWVSIAVLAESLETVASNTIKAGADNTYRAPGNPPLGNFMVEEMQKGQ
jgi:hypothetical protein